MGYEVAKYNPCFRERHVESSHLKGVLGKVYLHAVADTYSSYPFGLLHVFRKQTKAAVVAVLHSEALPFYSVVLARIGLLN